MNEADGLGEAGKPNKRKVNANPTKGFFVRMLTRDISLDDCILDLVDNSIDGAWDSSGHHPSEFLVNSDLASFEIQLFLTESRFEISDNCGGISLDKAANYAFTFGRTKDQAETEFSVGVYGIGMKRAVFKLGNLIEVSSTYAEGGQLTGLRVPINVQEWLDNDSRDWDFDLEELQPASQAGVTITVEELSEETRNRFADPAYVPALKRVLGRDYMVPLMRGLKISVNGEQVFGQTFSLTSMEELAFAAMRRTYDDGDVRVEIIAGMWRLPPDSIDPDEPSIKTDNTSGWYVICNGRVVLAADRTTITGWGAGDHPKWHGQYSGFAGLVFFSASRAVLLPMTTTKRSVDISSAVYRRALVIMAEPARAWIDYTNKRKNDETAKTLEEGLSGTAIQNLPMSPKIQLPAIKAGPARENVANINFAVPLGRMYRLASAFGNRHLSYRDVGQRAFDYSYEELVDEDGE